MVLLKTSEPDAAQLETTMHKASGFSCAPGPGTAQMLSEQSYWAQTGKRKLPKIDTTLVWKHDAWLSCFGSVSSSHGQEDPLPCQDASKRPAASFIHPSLAMFGVVAPDELPFPRQTGPKVG